MALVEGSTQPLAEPSAPLQDNAGQAAQVAAPAPAGQEPDAGSGQGEQQPEVDSADLSRQYDEMKRSHTEAMQKITAQAKAQGMITLRQDGIVKALKGRVSIEEIIRETEEA